MADPARTPRKQRTRQHIIAALSVNYTERFILEAGHVAHRVETDYGYDLYLTTHDENGYAEPGMALLQLKAAERLTPGSSGTDYVYDVDVADFDLWMSERVPVFLILFDTTRRRAYWLDIQDYFAEDASRRPRPRAKTVRVHVPTRQPLTRRAVEQMRARKQELLEPPEGTDDGA